MGGVGNQDLGTVFISLAKVGGKHEHRRQLSLGAGRGLQRHCIHSGNDRQIVLQFILQFEDPLGQVGIEKWVGRGQTRGSGHFLVNFRIVLHRT